jgi:hypothetical protein
MQLPVRLVLPLGAAFLVALPLGAHAQATPTVSPAAARRAAELITESGFRARLEALAHDSMRGRDTPSRELEKAADWVAAEFRRIGLTPAGDDGSYLQRVRLGRSRPDSASSVTATANGVATTWRLGREVAFLGGPPPESHRTLPVVLLAGVPADLSDPFGDVPVGGRAVMLVAPGDQLRNSVLNPLLEAATGAGVAVWIVAAAVPDEQWARLAARSLAGDQWEVAGRPPSSGQDAPALFFVQERSAAAFLSAAGEDPGTLLSPGAHGVRALAGAELTLEPVWNESPELVVPNVVGVLQGSDPTLRDEAVVFVAHMDHVGVTADGRCAAVGADSICNGANDNASGTVGVIELAEAYASLRPRPRRSLVFVTVAAEERGLLGAYHYADHPAIPIERTVAAVNFDMLVRNAPDSIQLIAKEYSTLGAVADRMAAEHSELNMVPFVDPVQHGFAFQSSDHYPFAVKGVPVLFFFSGLHEDLHGPTDSPERADCDKGARVARLAFYIGLEVANADGRPTWDPAARARVVGGGGGH